MRHISFVFAVLFLFFASPVFAWDYKVTPLLNLAFEFGGDTILNFGYSDGTTSSIEAGKGMIFSGGVLIPFHEDGPHTYEAQSTVGIKYTTSKPATNGEIGYKRYPIELLGFYRNTEMNFRAGGGLTIQPNSVLDGSGDFVPLTTNLKTAVGVVVQSDYFFGLTKNLSAGLRFTLISYETDFSSKKANGNSVGFQLSYYFL